MGYLVGNIAFVGSLWYIMKRENERRDRGERDDRLTEADGNIFLGDEDPRWRFMTWEKHPWGMVCETRRCGLVPRKGVRVLCKVTT